MVQMDKRVSMDMVAEGTASVLYDSIALPPAIAKPIVVCPFRTKIRSNIFTQGVMNLWNSLTLSAVLTQGIDFIWNQKHLWILWIEQKNNIRKVPILKK